MFATLTNSQLKSALTNEQIVAARAKGLAAADAVDPVAEEIAAALAKVDAFTGGYVVPADLLTGYARDIAAYQVAKRLGTPSDPQKTAYDRALKEIEDIRDGKFTHLGRSLEAATNTTGKVAHGSRTKVI